MTAAQKLQALLTASNNTTGESDATLTDAIQSLIGGYGQGGGGGFSFADFTKYQELTYVCAKTDNHWQTGLAHSLGVVPKMMLFFVVPSTSFSSDERVYADIQLFDSFGNPHYHAALAGVNGVVSKIDYMSGESNYNATSTNVGLYFRGYSQAGWTYRIYLWG